MNPAPSASGKTMVAEATWMLGEVEVTADTQIGDLSDL